MDLRTREGQEAAVLDQVQRLGGFTVFWATEHQKRSCAVDRLEQRGAIKRCTAAYPWCGYVLSEGDV